MNHIAVNWIWLDDKISYSYMGSTKLKDFLVKNNPKNSKMFDNTESLNRIPDLILMRDHPETWDEECPDK